MSEICMTQNYGIFTSVLGNRAVSEFHVEQLKKSIKKKNLTRDFPILVDDQFRILDGQHRFAALVMLNLPVYYRVSAVTTVDDIETVNTVSKKWTMNDYMKQFMMQGKEEYIKFNNFLEWSGIPSIVLGLKFMKRRKSLGQQTGGSGDYSIGTTDVISFKTGKFIYPNPDLDIKEKIEKIKQISVYLKNKNPFGRSLIIAFDSMTSDPEFNVDRLISKLEICPVGVYSDAFTLISEFENAYNYKERHENKRILRRPKK